MTDRKTLDQMNSDDLGQLYDQLDRAQRVALNALDHEPAATDAELRRQLEAAISALGKSETELAALRTVSRGYCPACGRGDATPTVADWEQQKQRADQAEARLSHLQTTSEAAGILLARTTDERDQLRATIERVRVALAAFDDRGVLRIGGTNFDIPTAGEVLDAVRTALGQAAAETTTQATGEPA